VAQPLLVRRARPSLKPFIDGGLRGATVNQYKAAYNADLAAYRQTVLTAFQQVEDSLATVRILSQQIQREQQAVESSEKALQSGTQPLPDRHRPLHRRDHLGDHTAQPTSRH
jgi:hypothetical protein